LRSYFSERQKDRVATVLIRTGGLLVILVVVAIVVNIGSEALPLFARATTGPVERMAGSPAALLAGSDARREMVWTLGADGRAVFDDPETADLVISESALVGADQEIHGLISVLGEDGTAMVGRLRFTDSWVGDRRTTGARWRASTL